MVLRIAWTRLCLPRLSRASLKAPLAHWTRYIQTQSASVGTRFERPPDRQSPSADSHETALDLDDFEANDDADKTDGHHVERARPAHWVEPEIMRAAKREVVWLMADKASLAKRIQVALDNEELSLALTITRLASRGKDEAVVAWNIIIKHAMRMKPVPHHDKAIRYYNEMKKRHQTPDVFTYGALFSGLNAHPQPSAIVERAFNLYRLMRREGSKVEPTILHYNMLISIAGRAYDMETFWKLVRDIPESGANAANAQTYVSIFESLRQACERKTEGEESTPAEAYEKFQEVGKAAIAIWGAAVDAWSKGYLDLDEEVVCSMARFIISSPQPKDSRLVYDLFEQTMGIPRYSGGHRPVEWLRGDHKSPFTPLPVSTHAIKVEPSIRSLMVALIVAQNCRLKQGGEHYWNLFTGRSGFGIEPDLPALKQYLRVLRISRSNQDVVKVLTSWQDQSQLDEATFTLALSTCRRNGWRNGALKDALQIYKLRQSLGRPVMMPVVETLLQIIDLSLLDAAATPDLQAEALQTIGPDVEQLLSTHNRAWTQYQMRESSSSEREERFVATVKIMQRAIDFVSHPGQGLKSAADELAPLKACLSTYMREYHEETPRSDWKQRARATNISARMRLVGVNEKTGKPVYVIKAQRFGRDSRLYDSTAQE